VFCVPDQGFCVCSPGRATTPVSFRRIAEQVGPRSMRAVGQCPRARTGGSCHDCSITIIGTVRVLALLFLAIRHFKFKGLVSIRLPNQSMLRACSANCSPSGLSRQETPIRFTRADNPSCRESSIGGQRVGSNRISVPDKRFSACGNHPDQRRKSGRPFRIPLAIDIHD
jgi:hypothetical protein